MCAAFCGSGCARPRYASALARAVHETSPPTSALRGDVSPPVYRFGLPKVVVRVPRIGRQPDHDACVRRWTQDKAPPTRRPHPLPQHPVERSACVTLRAIYEQASPRRTFCDTADSADQVGHRGEGLQLTPRDPLASESSRRPSGMEQWMKETK